MAIPDTEFSAWPNPAVGNVTQAVALPMASDLYQICFTSSCGKTFDVTRLAQSALLELAKTSSLLAEEWQRRQLLDGAMGRGSA